MTRTIVAPLAILWATITTYSSVHAQDIVPRTDIESTPDGVSFLDASGLGEGTSFYEAATLEIQLLTNDPIFKVENTFATNTYFYGESEDSMASLSLLRYTPQTTKMATDVVHNVLTGILHDRERHLFYEIRQNVNQLQTVRVTSEDDLPELADPVPASTWQRLTTFSTATPFWDTWSSRVNYYLGREFGPTVLGVMVLWTESSECYHSNLDPGCTLSDTTLSNMEAVVTLMIEETNTAIEQSGTGALINLAHMQRDSSGYVESDMRSTLNHISDLDFQLDYIQGLRNEKQADLVQFIVDNRLDSAGLGGIAWLPRTNVFGCLDSSAGFSVICAQCTTNYISAHEFGHNLGCLHDRGTANACGGCGGGNNYGYRSPTSSFRTIMSYQCTAGQCDNNPGNRCPRVPYFSGEAEYNGESLGGAENSCRKEIENMKGPVARYR